jgi:hypothetical protein
MAALAIRLNEVLPRPYTVDWDGDGVADPYDAWIELVNMEPEAVDLGGWALDDIPYGGTLPYVFPEGTVLGPGDFLAVYRSTTGVALNQDADIARLLAPDETRSMLSATQIPSRTRLQPRDGTGEDRGSTAFYPVSPTVPKLRRQQAPATHTATPAQHRLQARPHIDAFSVQYGHRILDLRAHARRRRLRLLTPRRPRQRGR